MKGGAVYDLYALAFGAGLAGFTLGVLWLRGKLRGRRRPYDWAVDGECDNRSHVKVVA